MQHFQDDRYAEAINLFERSLAINERFMPHGAVGLVTNLNNLASAHDKMGERETAVYFYERAVRVIHAHPYSGMIWDEQRRRARDHVAGKLARAPTLNTSDLDALDVEAAHEVAAALWEEGLRLHRAKDPASALELFEHTLTFNRKYRSDDSSIIATTLNNVGAAHEMCGHTDEAISYFQAAVETLKASDLPSKETKIAHVQNRLKQLQVSSTSDEPMNGGLLAPAPPPIGDSTSGVEGDYSPGPGTARAGEGTGNSGYDALDAPGRDEDGLAGDPSVDERGSGATSLRLRSDDLSDYDAASDAANWVPLADNDREVAE
mmetsp:Transcript_15711/g.38502  ORF Transcript_15711/g.38502 Transcript_15711/m.38502 type:complete len:319 (-) Transcript_15711:271-1227(-)